MPDLISECGFHAFGVFDRATRDLRVASLEACVSTVAEGSAYRRLSPEEFFTSIITHETVHAIFEDAITDASVGSAAREYAAYAIQLATMTPRERDRFLRGFKRETRTGLDGLHELVLHLAPETFAVLAYDHYRQPAHGCSFLRLVGAGKVRFPSLDDMH